MMNHKHIPRLDIFTSILGALGLLVFVAGCPIGDLTNQDPTANAGVDQNVDVGARVALSGLGSTDPDDDPLTYHWEQRSGPSVTLDGANSAQASFVPVEDGLYEFALTVTDGRGGSDEARVLIAVGNVPNCQGAPIADAGTDQTVPEGTRVTLRGGNSADPDGDVLSFHWTQIGGPAVSIADRFSSEPTFTAPEVAEETALEFEVLVTDECSLTDTGLVTITVQDLDVPGDPCAGVSCPPGQFCDVDTGECVDQDLCEGIECPVGETCDPDTGYCEPPEGCATDEECDDGDACTEEACVDGDCVYESIVCDEAEECVQGVCMAMACPTGEQCHDADACAGGASLDVRWEDLSECDFSDNACFYPATGFNQETLWPPPDRLFAGCDPESLLTNAMNPGLGIREIHSQGITGEGVNVAIIDQPMYPDHPEFLGKIAAYHDVGTGQESSMHGPAVASMLVGANCGTAPGARLYFVAAPSWLADSAYYAWALDWIVEQNAGLPGSEKIRVVSVSANPSGPPFVKNHAMWNEARARAEAVGILVLDVSMFIGPCWYDANDPENVAKCMPGFPGMEPGFDPGRVLVPTSPRTVAEEYETGQYGYAYWGRGGLSWGIPYAAGVLALGWEVRPELSAEQMRELLFQSAHTKENGAKIINPREFIRLVGMAQVAP